MKEINTDETQRTKAESTNGEEDSHHDGSHKMRRGQGCGRGIVSDIKRTIGTHWKGESEMAYYMYIFEYRRYLI